MGHGSTQVGSGFQRILVFGLGFGLVWEAIGETADQNREGLGGFEVEDKVSYHAPLHSMYLHEACVSTASDCSRTKGARIAEVLRGAEWLPRSELGVGRLAEPGTTTALLVLPQVKNMEWRMWIAGFPGNG